MPATWPAGIPREAISGAAAGAPLIVATSDVAAGTAAGAQPEGTDRPPTDVALPKAADDIRRAGAAGITGVTGILGSAGEGVAGTDGRMTGPGASIGVATPGFIAPDVPVPAP
jgi:hypothetical protein